jgi:hypothetical protein
MRAPTGPSPLEATVLTEALRAHPAAFVAFGLIAHAALWTLARAIADPTPAPETLVGLALGREWKLGYVEGPPLSFWVLETVYDVGGAFAAASLLPPLSVALTGWLIFEFARRVLGDRHGAIATLLMVGVHPVAFPVGALDSNLIQMPLVAASVLAWWKAVHDGTRAARYQLAVLVAALAYAGMQGLLVALVLFALTLASKRGREALAGLLLITKDWSAAVAGRDSLIAIILMMLLAAPRFAWLVWNDFAGLLPGSDSGIEPDAMTDTGDVVVQAMVGHMGLLVLLVVASSVAAADRETAPEFVRAPVERFALVGVMAIALLPAMLAAGLGIAIDLRQPVIAAAPLLLFSGVLVIVLAPDVVRIHRQRSVTIAALALLILPPTLDAVAALASPWFAERGRMSNWPAEAAGRYLTDVFRSRTGGRLEYVIGEPRIASAVAYGSADRPHVFFDGDPKRAPWIDQNRLRQRGAIVVWNVVGLNPLPPPALAKRFPGLTAEAPVPLNWVRPGRLDPVRLGWALIPPQQ